MPQASPIDVRLRQRFGQGRFVPIQNRIYFKKPSKGFRQRVREIISDTAETKRNYDEITVRNATASNPDTWQMTDIAQGDGVANRDGHEIYTRSFGGRYVVKWNSASTTCQYVRFVLYTPRNVDSLETTLTYTSRINPDEHIVYVDELIKLSDQEPCQIVTIGKKFYSKKVPGLLTKYLSSTPGDVITKPVVLVIVSSHDANPPTYEGYHQLFFKDK